jgi:hypothetical protein
MDKQARQTALSIWRQFKNTDRPKGKRYALDFIKKYKGGAFMQIGGRFILPLLFLLLLSSGAQGQSRKQIREAFNQKTPVKVVTFYCKSKKQYNKRVKRLLRIMDRERILNPIKVRYKESKKFYFKFEFKNWFPK